jgi:hypothetical protein
MLFDGVLAFEGAHEGQVRMQDEGESAPGHGPRLVSDAA